MISLEKYKNPSSRHSCPQCGRRSLTLYIDLDTQTHLGAEVGRCNRESKCGYHYPPRSFFSDKGIRPYRSSYQPPVMPRLTPWYIPRQSLLASLKQYDNNHLVEYLHTLFDAQVVSELVARYYVGTAYHWRGACVFWQIDLQGRIRTGKVMLYNPLSGKRVKEPFSHIAWVHRLERREGFELSQCLFGEHLLADRSKVVAVVESEKTAVIASGFMPQYIWVAVGSLSGLSPQRCKVLADRRVILFPDGDGYDRWVSKSKQLGIALISVSALFEHRGGFVKYGGWDVADVLVGYSDFTQRTDR